jgi:uncharacterized protein YaeQ
MALKATIFKAQLQVTDMDRDYYQAHQLTLARHPSETDIRMMVRLLIFALNADEALVFTRGLSTDDEPDLWQKNLSGDIELWIDIGQPDEKRIRKACGRAERVVIYSYAGHGSEIWWQQIQDRLTRFDNLQVISLPSEACQEMGEHAQRNMELQCTIQDGQAWINIDEGYIHIVPATLKTFA